MLLAGGSPRAGQAPVSRVPGANHCLIPSPATFSPPVEPSSSSSSRPGSYWRASLTACFIVAGKSFAAGRGRKSSVSRWKLALAASKRQPDALIVGAGVAGLGCAKHLASAGLQVEVVEASDGVGGRVRTDHVDGFTLDRGFHVFLDSYQESKRQLDFEALDLRPFFPGADVRFAGVWHRVADPFREPQAALLSLRPRNAVGTQADKFRLGLLRLASMSRDANPEGAGADCSLADVLAKTGLSDQMIDRFFRPLIGGIFFDPELRVSRRAFDFVFASLSRGQNCLPRAGIGAVAEQLANAATASGAALRLGVRLSDLKPGPVALLAGEKQEQVEPKALVIATDAAEALKFLGDADYDGPKGNVGTMCLYFALPEDELPTKEPVLHLNGELPATGAYGSLLMSSCTFISNVVPEYAPAGQALLSCSLMGVPDASDEEVAESLRPQLQEWFGPAAASWRLVQTYRVPFAQVSGLPPAEQRPVRVASSEGLYLCGEHREAGVSLDGALRSGRRCAEAVLEDLPQLQG